MLDGFVSHELNQCDFAITYGLTEQTPRGIVYHSFVWGVGFPVLDHTFPSEGRELKQLGLVEFKQYS